MIDTNVPNSTTMTLTISGTVWMPVDANPRAVNFGRLTPDELDKGPMTQRVTIMNNIEGEMKITNIKSTNPAFTAEAHDLEPGKKAELVVSLVPPISSGSLYGQITMETGIPDTPTVQVTASVFVTSDVEITPPVINILSNQKGTKQYVSVRVNSKDNVNVSDLQVSNSCMTPTLETITPGRYYRITIDIPTSCTLSPTGEQLTFKTDHPKFPTSTVTIYERTVPNMTPGQAGLSANTANPPSTTTFIPQNPAPVVKPASDESTKPRPAFRPPMSAQPAGGETPTTTTNKAP